MTTVQHDRRQASPIGGERRRWPTGARVCAAVIATLAGSMAACGGESAEPVTITAVGPNAVSTWNEIASSTVNLAAASSGTEEEQRPTYAVDLATVHVAIYDAVMAIERTHQPLVVTPTRAAAGAMPDAAVAAAAYRVLRGLFPARDQQYQAAYDRYLLTLPDGPAKTVGLALGTEVAEAVLARRAHDGRAVALSPYVPGTAPGQFRGNAPVNRFYPAIKPFATQSHAQFRAPGPPALTSSAYAADFNETKALGSATSSTRSAEQTALARFGTEPPPLYWTRNMRVFATTGRSLADHARLMAMVWVAQADATNACFESKYFHQTWRPTSAITLADTDGNDATVADPAWTPVVPTPNHPEYPAAHSCVTGAMAEVLNAFYGTARISFDMAATSVGITRRYDSTQMMSDEIQTARIAGGMHFRTATADGDKLGRDVARWIISNHFQPR